MTKEVFKDKPHLLRHYSSNLTEGISLQSKEVHTDDDQVI